MTIGLEHGMANGARIAVLGVLALVVVGAGLALKGLLDEPVEPVGTDPTLPVAPDDDTTQGQRPPPDDVAQIEPEVEPVTRYEAPKVAEPIAVDTGPAFVFEGHEERLRAFDWNALAAQLFELNDQMARLAPAIAAGRATESELMAAREGIEALHRHFGPRRELYPAALPIGMVAHPAVSANALARTLEASGVALDEDQAARLRDLAVDYIARDEARVARDKDKIWLTATAGEVVLRQEFLDTARGLLRPEQRRAVGGAYAGRIGLDPFSPTLVLRDAMIPLLRNEAEEQVHTPLGIVIGSFGMVDEEKRLELESIIRSWAASLGDLPFRHRPGRLAQFGHVDAERAVEALRLSADLYERVLAEASPGSAARMMLTTNRHFFGPAQY